MRWPLRRQMLLPMLGIMGLTLSMVSLVQAWLGTASLARQERSQQARIVQTLSGTNFPLDSNVLRQAAALVGAELVVTDATGRILASSDPGAVVLFPPTGAKAHTSPEASGRPGRLPWRQAALRLDRRAVGGPNLTLHLLYDRQTWDQARWRAIGPPLAVGGVGLMLVAVAATWIAGHVTRPIRQLQQQVQALAQGRFDPLPLPDRHDELRDLAEAINQLAQRLTDYDRQVRRHERLATVATLGAGMAHQLRNAATGCRMAIDLHRRDCPARGAAGGDDPLQVALRQLDHMESSIQRLLLLGRAEGPVRQPVDLAELAREALELVRPLAAHWGIALAFTEPQHSLVVAGDRTALVHALVELLLNAMEASLRGKIGTSDPTARTEAGQPLVQVQARVVEQAAAPRRAFQVLVSDPGPGLAPPIATKLFEPLTTDKPGGTGLGLASARRVAEDHGGTLRYFRQADRTCFVFEVSADASEGSV